MDFTQQLRNIYRRADVPFVQTKGFLGQTEIKAIGDFGGYDVVRTVAGMKRYGLPKGAPIIPGMTPGDFEGNMKLLRAHIRKNPSVQKGIDAAASKAPRPSRAKIKPVVGDAAPTINKIQKGIASDSPLNARGEARKYGPQGSIAVQERFPGKPLGAWSKEKMEKKIRDDAAKGFHREWIQSEAQAKKAAARIGGAFGEGAKTRFLAEWKNVKEQDINPDTTKDGLKQYSGKAGHIIVPADFDTYKGGEMWQVQRFDLPLSRKDANDRIMMKWQPREGIERKVARAHSKWTKHPERIAKAKDLYAEVTQLDTTKTPLYLRDPHAAAAFLTIHTGFRPARDAASPDADEKFPVGITTMKVQNVKEVNPRSGKVVFEFVPGKAAKDKDTGDRLPIKVELKDPDLARMLAAWTANRPANAWLLSRDSSGGQPVSYANFSAWMKERGIEARELRILRASGLAKERVDEYIASGGPLPGNKTQMAALMKTLATSVMEKIGHTQVSTTVNNYINPNVWLALGNSSLLPQTQQDDLI